MWSGEADDWVDMEDLVLEKAGGLSERERVCGYFRFIYADSVDMRSNRPYGEHRSLE